jgi:hypothetical protein
VPHAQASKRAIALHLWVLIVPSRQGHVAVWPGSHGTGLGPSLALSVSTTAEQLVITDAASTARSDAFPRLRWTMRRRMLAQLSAVRNFVR